MIAFDQETRLAALTILAVTSSHPELAAWIAMQKGVQTRLPEWLSSKDQDVLVRFWRLNFRLELMVISILSLSII